MKDPFPLVLFGFLKARPGTQMKKTTITSLQIAIWLHAMRLAVAYGPDKWYDKQWNKAFDAEVKHREARKLTVSLRALDRAALRFMKGKKANGGTPK